MLVQDYDTAAPEYMSVTAANYAKHNMKLFAAYCVCKNLIGSYVRAYSPFKLKFDGSSDILFHLSEITYKNSPPLFNHSASRLH